MDRFTDIRPEDWFFDSVKDVVERGLMNGTGDAAFSPHMSTSRAMVTTILWRPSGSPAPKAAPPYSDCPADSWYAQAVAWASESGVVKGYGNAIFAPDAPVTREQLVTMLYRYAKARTGSGDLSALADGGRVSDWAREAMTWAVAQGILTGKDGHRLDPQSTATRAEVATILQRFVEKR